MPETPIYEPEPLPEEGTGKTGLPHSSYEIARIRSARQEQSEAPDFVPRLPGPSQLSSTVSTDAPIKRVATGEPSFRKARYGDASEAIAKREAGRPAIEQASITAKFAELSEQAPHAHPDDIRSAVEGHARRTFGRNALATHGDHIAELTKPLYDHPERQEAIQTRSELLKKVAISKAETATGEDIVEAPSMRKRSTQKTDPAVMAVARALAKSHYRQNFSGKVKNDITGELHPAFVDSKANKSPMGYLKQHLNLTDPVQHIETNHAEDLAEIRANKGGLPGLARGGAKTLPPKAPTKTFALDYLKNPIAATFAKEKPAKMEQVYPPQALPTKGRSKPRTASFGEGQAK